MASHKENGKQNPRTTAISSWHLALNHETPTTLTTMAKINLFPALTNLNSTTEDYITCSSCAYGKSIHAQPPNATDKTTHPGQITSSDTMGPIALTSTGMHRHIIAFVEQFSRYLLDHPITTRVNVPNIIETTLTQMKAYHNMTPKNSTPIMRSNTRRKTYKISKIT